MILELLLVFSVLGVILAFFYKQAVHEFRILQTDSLEKAQTLLAERCPIVVQPAPGPKDLWTQSDIAARKSLQEERIGPFTLQQTIDDPSLEFIRLHPLDAQDLGTRVGLPTWTEESILPSFQTVWWSPLLSARTEVTLGAQPLRPTTAYQTVIIATDGALSVSLLNESADKQLPKNWRKKRLTELTRDDTPHLAQIQYIDVIVRPGSALIVPPHWRVGWETKAEGIPTKPALGAWIEIHHPLSWLVHRAANRKI